MPKIGLGGVKMENLKLSANTIFTQFQDFPNVRESIPTHVVTL